MRTRVIPLALGLLTAVALAGCNVAKTSNPLSPTIAGPIPGVEISQPKLLEPAADAKFSVEKQPLTLVIENASTNGVRPVSYVFEVAIDANFTNKVFVREGVQPGEGGRTSVQLPDRLAPERTYYWRARGLDGANEGSFASGVHFNIFTPIVIGGPDLRSPGPNSTIGDLRPSLGIINVPRSGPAGAITYQFELATDGDFVNRVAVWTQGEQGGQTTTDVPQDLNYATIYYWRVRAADSTVVGPWSGVWAFVSPLVPVPSPGGGGGGGGGGNPNGGHITGPLNEATASAIVNGTGDEFPGLLGPFGSEGEAVANADVLLQRTIWHLQLAGFNAARQRNPSGLISSDKIAILMGGAWHCYDIYSLGVAGRATSIHENMLEVPLPSPLPSGGIPD